MSKMLRNMVGAKPDVSSADLKRYVSWLLLALSVDTNFGCVIACSNNIGSNASESSRSKHSAGSGGF